MHLKYRSRITIFLVSKIFILCVDATTIIQATDQQSNVGEVYSTLNGLNDSL